MDPQHQSAALIIKSRDLPLAPRETRFYKMLRYVENVMRSQKKVDNLLCGCIINNQSVTALPCLEVDQGLTLQLWM